MLAGFAVGAAPEFRSAVTNAPLSLDLRPGDELTEGMKQFYASGQNPYAGRADALARGKELYNEVCQVCHMPDGSGRIGPSLIDDRYINPRANTEVGMFEILLGGAFGAMRPVYDRMSQDEMLKVLAYVKILKK
jgi:cytochrome c-L